LLILSLQERKHLRGEDGREVLFRHAGDDLFAYLDGDAIVAALAKAKGGFEFDLSFEMAALHFFPESLNHIVGSLEVARAADANADTGHG